MNHETHGAPHRSASRVGPATLNFFGFGVLLLSLAVGLGRLMNRTESLSDLGLTDVADLAAWTSLGLAFCGLMLGLSASLSMLNDLRAALVRLEKFQYEIRSSADAVANELDASRALLRTPPAAGVGDAQITSAQWQEMLLLLRDLRDNSLLSEQERGQKKERVTEDEIIHTETTVASLLTHGEFAHARQLADALYRKYPQMDRTYALLEHVEQTREQRETSDIKARSKEVDDLISISAWDRARQVAEQLQKSHPESEEARQVMLRVEREFKVFEREQQRRLYAEIQRYVTRRRWSEALVAAETYLERFPHSPEADAIRLQIETLTTNAEIEARQQLEAEIMDLARHGRYIEALTLAKTVIDRYPTSPQAEVLRGQLPRLEELALDPKAQPARVREE